MSIFDCFDHIIFIGVLKTGSDWSVQPIWPKLIWLKNTWVFWVYRKPEPMYKLVYFDESLLREEVFPW